MHTATSLDSSMFHVEADGRPSTREALLDVRPHDRLGVVVAEPLGAVGASLLIQLMITAYFDARPERRSAPHYAEVYLFHIGGRHGDFSHFDIMPPRKEVVVEDDPGRLIEAINDRAITHLAVPHGPPVTPWAFPWKEAEAAIDRVRACFAYGATGRTPGADVAITSTSRATLEDLEGVIDPRPVLARIPGMLEAYAPDDERRRGVQQWGEQVRARLPEVSEVVRRRIADQRRSLEVNGHPRETYRRIPVEEALGILASRGDRSAASRGALPAALSR